MRVVPGTSDWHFSDWKEIDGLLSSARFAKLESVAINICGIPYRVVFKELLRSLDTKGILYICYF